MRIVAELICTCPETHHVRREAALSEQLLKLSVAEARLGYVRAAQQEVAAGAVRDWLSTPCGTRRLAAMIRIIEVTEGEDFAAQLARELAT